ncbi:MAG TPA: VOC family protein [Vicinamibacteria bacterium]|nr:VOC family protein [Vicinamibacteria bacterium]
MSDKAVGSIVWTDLTVDDAEAIRDFYARVVGLRPEPVDMGDYSDFNLLSESGEPVAGVCHARGSNQNLPPQWLVYFTVKDVDVASRRAVELGGEIVDGPRDMGKRRFCVVRDPAGAVAALISQ